MLTKIYTILYTILGHTMDLSTIFGQLFEAGRLLLIPIYSMDLCQEKS